MSDALDWAVVSKAIQNWVVLGSGLAADKAFWEAEGRPRPAAPYIHMRVSHVRGIGHDWSTLDWNVLDLPQQAVTGVDAIANTLAIAAHPFLTGDGPVRIASSGTLPAPLTAGTDYWVIKSSAGAIQLASTFIATGGGYAGGDPDPDIGNAATPIDLTSTGSGTITVSTTEDSLRAGQELLRTASGIREVVVRMECVATDDAGYDAVRILTNVVASLQLYGYDLDQAGVGVTDLGQASSQGVQYLAGRRGGILEPRAIVDFTFYLASNLTGFETIIESAQAQILLQSEANVPLAAISVQIP